MQEFKNFDQYAEMMQKMYAEALEVAETVKKAAEDEREEAFRELDAAREAKKEAEANGEKMALDYFARRRKFIEDTARQDLLGRLILMHLRDGKPVSKIMQWLDVEEEDIEKYQEILKREKAAKAKPALHYTQDGRGGKVIYTEGETTLEFDWEFAGGNGVAIIFVPQNKYWEAQTGIPLEERMEILEFVGQQAVKDKAPECIYEISDGFVEILYPR
jgi:cation transport regulator ChaB